MLVNKILLSPIRENITCPKDLLSLGFHVGNLRELYGSRGQKFDQLTRGMLSDFASQGLSGGAWDFQVDWGPILQQETQKLARKRRHKRVISEVKKVRRSE